LRRRSVPEDDLVVVAGVGGVEVRGDVSVAVAVKEWSGANWPTFAYGIESARRGDEPRARREARVSSVRRIVFLRADLMTLLKEEEAIPRPKQNSAFSCIFARFFLFSARNGKCYPRCGKGFSIRHTGIILRR